MLAKRADAGGRPGVPCRISTSSNASMASVRAAWNIEGAGVGVGVGVGVVCETTWTVVLVERVLGLASTLMTLAVMVCPPRPVPVALKEKVWLWPAAKGPTAKVSVPPI